jgi:hypothetical protein
VKTFVCVLGLLVGGFFVVPVAFAAPTRIVILDRLDLPSHMANFQDKVRVALESAAIEKGREVVNPVGTGWCATVECFRGVARATGAAEVMTIAGGRNEYEGWHLEIEIRRADGEVRIEEAGGCNICSGPEMVASAGLLARGIFARAPAEIAEAAAPAMVALPSVPTPVPMLPPSVPASPESTRSTGDDLLRDSVIAGAGVLAASAGVYLWWLNDRDADCEANPARENVCPTRYRTARIGIPLTVAGAAAVAVGTIMIIRDLRSRSTGVAIWPGAFALVGRF